MKVQGISEEDIKLRAFPFSLVDGRKTSRWAKDWFYYLSPSTINLWNEMRKAFLNKFFPTSRIAAIWKSICGVQQLTCETLHEYWERFKRHCASCPQHQISDQLLIQYFYEGLFPVDRSMVDATSGGALVNETSAQARELIEVMATNYQQFGTRPKQHKVENKLGEIASLIRQMTLNQTQQPTTQSVQIRWQ